MGEDSDCYDCCLAVFEPHFKRQGNVGYRHAFFFFLLVQFSQIFIFWKANASLHFPGFAQMQTSGRDSLERSSFALSYFTHTHTHTDAAQAQQVRWPVTLSQHLPNTYLWLSFVRQVEGEAPVITTPHHWTNLSGCFFLGSFSQILKGSTDLPPKIKNCWAPPNLHSPTLLASLPPTLREFQKDNQGIIGSNQWEVW